MDGIGDDISKIIKKNNDRLSLTWACGSSGLQGKKLQQCFLSTDGRRISSRGSGNSGTESNRKHSLFDQAVIEARALCTGQTPCDDLHMPPSPDTFPCSI